MSKTLSYKAVILGGADVRTQLTVPVLASDPGSPVEGDIWLNSTTDQLKYHNGTGVAIVGSGSGVTTEDIQDAAGAMAGDTATAQLVYNDGSNTLRVNVLDSPTVAGQTPSQLQTTITSAIVDAAPGTLDTLNELAAALNDDPNFSATITASIAAKAGKFSAGLTGGATSEVVTHNLNTRDVHVAVYSNTTPWAEEEYIVERTTVNTVTIRSEGGNIPSGRRVVVLG